MAKLTSPLYSEEAHGRVGAVVYRNWRGAATASVMPCVHKRHTPLVRRTLSRMSPARKRWTRMKARERAAWRHHVREVKLLKQYNINPNWTGYDWWIRCALIVDYVGAVHLGKPPSEPMASCLESLSPVQLGVAILVNYDYHLGETVWTHWIEVRIMGPHSPGRSPRLKDCKRAGSWYLGQGPLIRVNEQPGLYTLFARTVDSQGLTSPHIRASITMEF